MKPCTKDISSWLQVEPEPPAEPNPASHPIPPQANGSLILRGLCPFAASPGQWWVAWCPPCMFIGPSLGSSCCPAVPRPPLWGWLLGLLALTSPYFGCVAAAREQDVSPQILQRLMELLPTMGLTTDMLAILPKSGEWPKGTGWQLQPLCLGALCSSGCCQWHTHPSFCFPTDQCINDIR